MRLIRFGPPGSEKPGVLLADGKRRDLSEVFRDWDAKFFESAGLQEISELLRTGSLTNMPLVPDAARWASPVARPGKVICIGLNYFDHAKETGMPIPPEPIIFGKAANTVVGPYDEILIPRGSKKTDWEVELGVVIGRTARYLGSEIEAFTRIAGYCISHDVSEREFQLERGGQWTKGKSCDHFNPLGPWLVTQDEIASPSALSMSLRVNGNLRQQGSTSTMIFGVGHLVHYVSQFMTLEAGDLISTGTPPGVGMGRKPPEYLRAGDIVELEIEGLGHQKQSCIQA